VGEDEDFMDKGDEEQHGEGIFDMLGNLRTLIPLASSLIMGGRRKRHSGDLNTVGGHMWGN
jgi:hypothetical protein